MRINFPIILAFTALIVQAQTKQPQARSGSSRVSASKFSGRVVDTRGAGLAGVLVELVSAGEYTFSDGEGRYSFGKAPGAAPEFPVAGSLSKLKVEGLDLIGRTIKIRNRSSKAAWVSRKDQPVSGQSRHKVNSFQGPADSLRFILDGFEAAVHAAPSRTGAFPDVVMRPGLTFSPYFLGTGEITDISNSRTSTLPLSRRLHVILLPEGYTQEDIAAGKYQRDLDSWFRSVFALEPLSSFKQAFVIWKYPVASRERVQPGRRTNTFFSIPVKKAGVSGSLKNAAATSWKLIRKFFHPPREFYGSRGITGNRSKNLLLQFMVLDPSRGRSGFSGQATSFQNPSNSKQRVGVAIAQNQQHEFLHALAHLMDEYYDAGHRPTGSETLVPHSAHVTNVVSSPACRELPWKHLLPGGSINPQAGNLIGAFGAKGRYHPELKCLMNGLHDNADLFGGHGNLRVQNRMCNFCRELTVFRIYEKTGLLPDPEKSWQTWIARFRSAFYEKFGFLTPVRIPQENNQGKPWYQACTPQ